MSEQKSNNATLIMAVVALLVAIGAGGYFFTKNNEATEQPVAQENMATAADTATAAQANPAVDPAEADEASQTATSAGQIDGVTVKPGNPIVAKVDGKDITRVDVFRFIKMMPPQVQQLPPAAVYPLALEQVINTQVVQNKANDAGLDNDPEVQKQLAMAKEQIVRTIYVQRAVDKDISDSDLKAKYNETIGKQPAVDEVKAAHILVDSEEKAKDLIQKLVDGADFAKLASENSGDPGNKDKGGELGWFAKADMVPEFSEAAFNMAQGDVSKEPVKTQFGWHVIKVEDKRVRPKPSFDEVKPMLQAELRREKIETILDGWVKSAKVEKFDVNGDPVKSKADVAPAAGEEKAAE